MAITELHCPEGLKLWPNVFTTIYAVVIIGIAHTVQSIGKTGVNTLKMAGNKNKRVFWTVSIIKLTVTFPMHVFAVSSVLVSSHF